MTRLDVGAIGDICVDFLVPPLPRAAAGDRQDWVPSLRMVPGGNAANFALGCAALGLRTGLAACLGDDAIASFLRDALRRAGIHSMIRTRRGEETGRTVALHHADGTRHLITYNGSNLPFRPSDVPAGALHALHVHRAGYWWTPRLMGAPTRALLRRARQNGASTSLDIATDPQGWTVARRASVRKVLPDVTVFFANPDELSGVFGGRNLDAAAEKALRIGIEIVAVHHGSRGCLLFTANESLTVRGFRVRNVNPTGAGDLFNAGFVLGMLERRDLRTCGRIGNALGALHAEDRAGPYPRRREVRRRFPSLVL